jgi:hypothetical protein
MDSLRSHDNDRFLEQYTEHLVEVLFLVPHASDQTQPLNLLTFALMKQRYSASKFQRLTNRQSNEVVRILGAWFAASAPHHNVEAFMSLGLIPFRESNCCFLRGDRERARGVREWPRTSGGILAADLLPEAQQRRRRPTGA